MILVDVNIFIDVLSGRGGFESSIKIIDSVRNGKIQGRISALTIPILWFLLSKTEKAKDKVKNIVDGFEIIPLTKEIIQKSFESDMEDFEDAIQFHSALEDGCDAIITRNKKDFEGCEGIEILTPEEFLSRGEIK